MFKETDLFLTWMSFTSENCDYINDEWTIEIGRSLIVLLFYKEKKHFS